MKPSDDPEVVRLAQVRELFRASSYPRDGTGVLIFFAWLEKNRPELLPKDKMGGPFQHLKIELHELYED